MKTAIVTGINGQDGSFLAELLLSYGYHIIGVRRRSSSEAGLERIEHLLDHKNLTIVEGEISDGACVYQLVQKYLPDEIYNLAAQSHVGISFEQPEYTLEANAKGPLHFLEAIKRYCKTTKFYQASTSEMFGKNFSQDGDYKYQNEQTPFMPQSPYAVAKLAAHELVRIYREGYGLFACCGILFNHESERRGENFVTRKITKWIGDFTYWLEENGVASEQLSIGKEALFLSDQTQSFAKLRLGNLDACRDWGHAEDYVKAMHMMLQNNHPDDYVISSGATHSVRAFLKEAFKEIGILNFEPYVVIDPKFYRPAEVDWLLGDSKKAKKELGWEPKVTFSELVQRMVKSDIERARKKRAFAKV
jgi:GDPmannose 4,6-dehydratase